MCDENVDVPRVARCSPFPLTWGTLWVKKKYLKFLKICLVHVKEESSGNFAFQMSVMLRKINLFGSNAPFLYLLKTSENRKIFRCFQGVEKGCIGNKWVKYRFIHFLNYLCTRREPWHVSYQQNLGTY